MLHKEKIKFNSQSPIDIDFFSKKHNQHKFKSKKIFDGFLKSFIPLIFIEILLIIFICFIIINFCIISASEIKINHAYSFSYNNSISSSDIQLINQYLKK